MTIAGRIDENFVPERQAVGAARAIVDLGGITIVSSIGIRNLQEFLASLAPARVMLVNLSPAIAVQINFIPTLAEGMTVVSARLPFVCPTCAAELDHLVPWRSDADRHFAPNCSCGAAMELDGMREHYLPSEPPEPPDDCTDLALLLSTGAASLPQASERALQRAEMGFRALLDHSPDGIAIEEAGRITYCNPVWTRMLGFDQPSAIHGKSLLELVVLDDHPSVNATLEALNAKRHASHPILWRLRRANGEEVVVEGTALQLALQRTPVRVFTIRDLTERRQMEEQLRLSDRLASVGALAAGVAHEINNPLTYVVANLSYLAEALGNADRLLVRRVDLLEIVKDAQEGAERVRTIVRDLKTFSRPDEEHKEALPVGRILESAANMAWNEIRHRARFVKELGDVPMVWANEARLGQVFLNLLINAAQAITEDDVEHNVIRMVTRTDDQGRVVIEVSDTGPGIPPEILPRIFEPFFTTKPIGVGTGLGLSICRRIITALGGQIEFENVSPRGATVRVILPAAPITTTQPVPNEGHVHAPRQGRVLIIDDEVEIGKALQRTLEQHDVVALTDARQALARLSAGEVFDVILCDLMMPKMSGVDFYHQVLSTAPDAVASIIFLTGGAFTGAAQSFLDGVRNVYLEKPVSPDRLREAVAVHLKAA